MIELEGSIYTLESNGANDVEAYIHKLDERIVLLRQTGTLSEATLKQYYGEKRFEHVAESNALEGSTLNVGETEIAILKGVTLSGHDPGFVRDAVALDQALQQVVVLARSHEVTDLDQLLEVHRLLMGDRQEAGEYRDVPIRIRGSRHTPPKTYKEVCEHMDQWQAWSKSSLHLAAPLRAAVLHAWLTHIHPFVDGNGRCARAISNLELIRAGYPPIIINKRERSRYLQALAESDHAGDLRTFLELILEKVNGALTGLESSASKQQDYNPFAQQLKRAQAHSLQIFNTSLQLLTNTLGFKLDQYLEGTGGEHKLIFFGQSLDQDTYLELCRGISVTRSWSFQLSIHLPGVPALDLLAYFGYHSNQMKKQLKGEGGPSIFWSIANKTGYPRWRNIPESMPMYQEMATMTGVGDAWFVRDEGDKIIEMGLTDCADKLAQRLLAMVARIDDQNL